MAEAPAPKDRDESDPEAPMAPEMQAVLTALATAPTFGPAFFLSQLVQLVRDSCPAPSEGLPRVLVHVAGGDVLDVCHVIAIAPRWVALAVFDEEDRMVTEFVPYPLITRLSVCAPRAKAGERKLGFRQDVRPPLIEERRPDEA